MIYIKEPLLLIGKGSLCGGSRFPFSLSEYGRSLPGLITKTKNLFYMFNRHFKNSLSLHMQHTACSKGVAVVRPVLHH